MKMNPLIVSVWLLTFLIGGLAIALTKTEPSVLT